MGQELNARATSSLPFFALLLGAGLLASCDAEPVRSNRNDARIPDSSTSQDTGIRDTGVRDTAFVDAGNPNDGGNAIGDSGASDASRDGSSSCVDVHEPDNTVQSVVNETIATLSRFANVAVDLSGVLSDANDVDVYAYNVPVANVPRVGYRANGGVQLAFLEGPSSGTITVEVLYQCTSGVLNVSGNAGGTGIRYICGGSSSGPDVMVDGLPGCVATSAVPDDTHSTSAFSHCAGAQDTPIRAYIRVTGQGINACTRYQLTIRPAG